MRNYHFFGANVHVARHAREWPQRELASRAELPQQRVSLIERGSRPTAREMEKLADALGVGVDRLLAPSRDPLITITPDAGAEAPL